MADKNNDKSKDQRPQTTGETSKAQHGGSVSHESKSKIDKGGSSPQASQSNSTEQQGSPSAKVTGEHSAERQQSQEHQSGVKQATGQTSKNAPHKK